MHGLLRWQGLALGTGLGHLHEGLVDGLRGAGSIWLAQGLALWVSPGQLTVGFLMVFDGF